MDKYYYTNPKELYIYPILQLQSRQSTDVSDLPCLSVAFKGEILHCVQDGCLVFRAAKLIGLFGYTTEGLREAQSFPEELFVDLSAISE